MAAMGDITCGSYASAEGIAKSALLQVAQSIDAFSTRIIGLLNGESTNDILDLGPFCARVVLENSCVAILGRIDLFRILYLSEFQAQPQYEYGRQASSGFRWTGDVIPEEKSSINLWSSDNDKSKISRALFSRHYEHLYWKPAVDKMLDFVRTVETRPTLFEILNLDSTSYMDKTRGLSIQLYSSLSKGVHWEFFSSASMFDEPTVRDLLRDTMLLVGHLGLISHFIPTAYASLSPSMAVTCYQRLRRDIL